MQTVVFQNVTLIIERGKKKFSGKVLKQSFAYCSFLFHLLRNLVLILLKEKHLNRWIGALNSYMNYQVLVEKC